MKTFIRKYENKDGDHLKQLLTLYTDEADYLVSILNGPNLKYAFTAFYGGKLIGTIIAWNSNFHPNCIYFRMILLPNDKGLYLEEKLLGKLVEEENEGLPLQTSIWETAGRLKNFYQQTDLKIIRKTYMPTLTVSKVNPLKRPAPDGYCIKTLDDLLEYPKLVRELTKLVKRTYEQTHLANPVAEMELEEWRKLIFADDTIMAGSFICLDVKQQEILAYTFLHEGEAEDTLELGWCGAKSMQYMALIPQLFRNQIAYANNNVISFIQGEFDTTDPYSMEVLKTFPFSPCTAWITYQRH